MLTPDDEYPETAGAAVESEALWPVRKVFTALPGVCASALTAATVCPVDSALPIAVLPLWKRGRRGEVGTYRVDAEHHLRRHDE